MTEIDVDGLAELRAPFPPEVISTLPRGGTQLSYVGHADITDRLLTADPLWSWEPVAFADDGLPAIRRTGDMLELWIRLTVCGHTRLGVGTCQASKQEATKELVGDAIRNAAMRFGAALDLWSKNERLESQMEELQPVATPGEVAALVGLFDALPEDGRASAKQAFVARWGRPDRLTARDYPQAFSDAQDIVNARSRPADVSEDEERIPEPDGPVDDSTRARRYMKAEVLAHTPDGMTEDQFMDALLVKANAMMPQANKGEGFESWRNLQPHPSLIAELLEQAEAGTLSDLGQEAFL